MTVNIKGINTNYIVEGSSDIPVIILPGWGATSAVYNLIVKQLSETRRVYVLDLPGFGITPEPSSAWSVDDYADFVVSFVEELKIKELVFMGHSFGGRIIINLCNRDGLSFAIKEAVLVDSAGIKNPLTKEQQKRQDKFKKLKKFYSGKAISRLFPKALEKLQKKYGSSDYVNASPIMKQTLVKTVTNDYTDKLPSIKQRVFLIWGEDDTATPISDARKMNELIPNSTLEVIANAGHFPFIDQPFEFRTILDRYISASL